MLYIKPSITSFVFYKLFFTDQVIYQIVLFLSYIFYCIFLFLIVHVYFLSIFSFHILGESWLTTIALDLVQSLTNPFTSYKGNMKRYQIMVWSFTGIVSFIFYFNIDCQGRFDHGICWVKITSTNSPCLWGYFLFWIVCMYAYQMWASTFAYMRLRRGLPLTFEIRKQCALETFKCLSIYACYLSVMMFFFAII